MHVGETKETMSSSSSRPRTRRQVAEFYKNVVQLKDKNQASNGSEVNSGLLQVKIEQDDNYVPINSGLFEVKIDVDDLPNNVVSVDRVSTGTIELDLIDGNFVDDGNWEAEENLGNEIVTKDTNLQNERNSRLVSESNVSNVGEKTKFFDVLEKAKELPQVDFVANNLDLDNSSRDLDGTDNVEHLSGKIVSTGCASKKRKRRISRLGSVSNVGNVGKKTNRIGSSLGNRRSSKLRSLSNVGNRNEDENPDFVNLVENTSDSDNLGQNSVESDSESGHWVREIVSNGSSLGKRRISRPGNVGNGDKNTNLVDSFDLVANTSDSDDWVRMSDGENEHLGRENDLENRNENENPDFVNLVENTSDSDNSGQNSVESDSESGHWVREIVSNGSSLGKRRISRPGNVGNGDKNTNLVDSFDLVANTSDSDDSGWMSDGENEHLGRENNLENRRSSRFGSASNLGNIDENVNNVDTLDLVSNTSDSDNLGGDSDGSDSDQSVDSESSSEEEDTEDPNSPSTGDDSDYVSGEIGFYSNKDVRTNGDEGNSDEDPTGDKTLRSGRKVKRMNFSGDVSKDDSYYSNESCLKKRKLHRLEILVHFGETSETELRTFKFQKKNGSQLGKNTGPSSVVDGGDESDSSTDDKFESLRRELCGRKRKGKNGKEAEKRSRAARSMDFINILADSMKNPIEEGDTRVNEPLPLKFEFKDDVPPREKTESEKEIDSLFLDLDLALRASEIDDSADISKKANENPTSAETDKSRAACCGGESILDEQIGIICRSCGAILLEIKDMLPPWYTPSWRRRDRKEFLESQCSKVGEFQFQDSGNGRHGSFTCTEGTVWDLIPGFEKDMFPHQCEGFEFLWKNIAGDTRIENLPKTLPNDSKGCIISHAPGTGKTRLTIVFLLSFLKRYPNANPVIIAPCGMLDTWEEEFIKWKVNIPFHNMNSELSANEIQLTAEKAGRQLETRGGMNKEDIRLVKLCSWISSGGVLGIGYQLFGTIASKCEEGEKEAVIWKTLVEKPGVLILDEGHTPRNDGSNIWNALHKVATQRRVILSGTPFQNNFKELYNTFCLIDPKFLDKATWKKLTEGRNLKGLRTMLDPYVHLHKGTILQQRLLGLRDTIVFLRPAKLQMALLDAARKVKEFLTRTSLVSLISVHPSIALMVAERTSFSKNRTFSLHKDELQKIESDLDAGVKMKFVINLIQLADALGERVLIFSQYLDSLTFIKRQLIDRFSWCDGREVLYMDGQLDMKRRQESISSLNNSSSEAKVLLASLKACSEGINLVGASRVVLLDTVWNPSVERQAICRAYRLGQKKMVYVYRLIISGMEDRQYELQAQKDHISEMIFSPVDGRVRKGETSGVSFEDKILEQMHNLKSCEHIFERIVHQPKEREMIETFGFVES